MQQAHLAQQAQTRLQQPVKPNLQPVKKINQPVKTDDEKSKELFVTQDEITTNSIPVYKSTKTNKDYDSIPPYSSTNRQVDNIPLYNPNK